MLFPFTPILLLLFLRISHQSQCIVSEWGTWSKCHGGCQKGLVVRNRDVLQPPLQELTPEGRMMQRLCPHLYETKYCDKSSCQEQTTLVNYQDIQSIQRAEDRGQLLESPSRQQIGEATSARNLVEKQMRKIGFGRDNDPSQAKLKQKFISETEQLFKLDDAINRRYGPQPSDHLVNNISSNKSIIDISTQQMSSRQWRDDRVASTNKWTSPTPLPPYQEHRQAFDLAGISTTVYPETFSTLSTSSVEFRGYRQSSSRRQRPSNDHSVSLLLRKIEQALDTNQPLDDKYIKNAYRRNRKLSKLLVDAYRQRQALMNSGVLSSSMSLTSTTNIPTAVYSTTTYPSPTTTTTTTTTSATTTTRNHPMSSVQPVIEDISSLSSDSPAFVTGEHQKSTSSPAIEEEFSATTTIPMLYWPKTGYVPNTRKHASDITNQLYMTDEIVQTLADDPLPAETNPDCEANKRCCKIIKNTCSDGIDPKFVKRWYRPKGSSVCVPYHYPRCSSFEEMEEQPILFEQNCQDLCFSKQEKRISPLFQLELEDE